MRKLRILLCALCLALLVPLLLRAAKTLPVDTGPLVAEKYAGWSGVLRLWVYEGWPSGVTPWLNRCISRFEKAHPGVYVQPRAVDPDAIRSLNDSGILPPDMLLLPPGLLTSPQGLAALEAPIALRAPLADCGAWRGATYAVPVAMGGYLWAWNAGMINAIPGSWRETSASLAVPLPEDWRRWDAALLALCSGRYRALDDSPATPGDVAPPGLDLGLAGTETPAPTPTAVPEDGDTLPCRLPDGFQYDGDAWRHFVNGEAAAMPMTQREIRRLQALGQQGKGPDWRLSRGGGVFSDQLLYLAIVDREGAEAQQALCREFLDWLLSGECQGELYRSSIFSVTDVPSGYEAGDPLLTMDSVLRDPELRVPPCFGGEWLYALENNVQDFIANIEDSSTLWPRLGKALSKNPND